ncbi:MAG: DUF4199 family protein [Bacteroidales bacterium]|jgi:hypothetical protein|nr:DUF4199 family protein [Bacteroidales bacterium]
MNKNLKTIIFSWGGMLAGGTIIFHLLNIYVVPADGIVLKNIIDVCGLIFSFFCIYKAMYAYRALQGEKNPFPAIEGIKASMGTLFVFTVLFLTYSLFFYNFVNKNFVEEYKQKQTAIVLNSDLPEEEKEKHIQATKQTTTTSYVVSNLLQRLVLPATGMLFMAAFMQRKPAKNVEAQHKENQPS